MSASTGASTADCERPGKGADAWVGKLLLLGSGIVSLKCLAWLATIIGNLVMR